MSLKVDTHRLTINETRFFFCFAVFIMIATLIHYALTLCLAYLTVLEFCVPALIASIRGVGCHHDMCGPRDVRE